MTRGFCISGLPPSIYFDLLIFHAQRSAEDSLLQRNKKILLPLLDSRLTNPSRLLLRSKNKIQAVIFKNIGRKIKKVSFILDTIFG